MIVVALGPPVFVLFLVMGWATREWETSALITLASCAFTAAVGAYISWVVG